MDAKGTKGTSGENRKVLHLNYMTTVWVSLSVKMQITYLKQFNFTECILYINQVD